VASNVHARDLKALEGIAEKGEGNHPRKINQESRKIKGGVGKKGRLGPKSAG